MFGPAVLPGTRSETGNHKTKATVSKVRMDINRLAEVLEEVVKRLDQTQNEKNKLDHVMERLDTLEDKLERLDQKTDFIKTQIVEIRDKSSSEAEIKDGRKLQGEIEQVKTSITSLAGHLDTVRTSIATVVQKIDSVETSLNDGHITVIEDLKKGIGTIVQKIDNVKTSVKDGHKTVKEDLRSLKQGQDLVTTKIEQSTKEVKDDMYRSKREIFAVTEKEAQIVRDRIEGPLPSLGKYSFDFYLEDFKTLVRSGKRVNSMPWHINEQETMEEGEVYFLKDGNIDVGFIYGPWPDCGLKVKATICGGYGKVLQDIVLGERTFDWDKDGNRCMGPCGWPIGVTSCDDLINAGYGEKEGYRRGRVLIRYDVTVL